jgi:hypothetical protein
MLTALRLAARRNPITWRYLFNFGPTLTYQMSRYPLSPEARRVADELDRNGVAMTTVAKLFGRDSLYEQMASEVVAREGAVAVDLAAARAAARDDSTVGKKTFIYMLLGDTPPLEPDGIFARFALQEPILRIANAYIGMHTRLRYYNVWRTFATTDEARESQLWHRDRDDKLIVKVFVYLSDVDATAGPFTYAPGTHRKRVLAREPEYFVEGNVKRTTDEQMAQVVPADRWVTCTGPTGTIVFADTGGYHKGGLARGRDRLMYTCMFTSPAADSREEFRRITEIPPAQDRERAFALAGPRRGAWLSFNAGR